MPRRGPGGRGLAAEAAWDRGGWDGAVARQALEDTLLKVPRCLSPCLAEPARPSAPLGSHRRLPGRGGALSSRSASSVRRKSLPPELGWAPSSTVPWSARRSSLFASSRQVLAGCPLGRVWGCVGHRGWRWRPKRAGGPSGASPKGFAKVCA